MVPKRPPNLFEYLIARGKPLNLKIVCTIAKQLLLTLQQLHSRHIVHLDLNPHNILVLMDIENIFKG